MRRIERVLPQRSSICIIKNNHFREDREEKVIKIVSIRENEVSTYILDLATLSQSEKLVSLGTY
jgi:hypothetical protein